MPVLTVADTDIPYEIRRSRRARRLRVVVAPGKVEVVAPYRAWGVRIDRFVRANRHWIYEKFVRLLERERAGEFSTEPLRFVSGATIFFRGRRMRLQVEETDVASPQISYRSAFHVRVPCGMNAEAKESAVEATVNGWLEDRARSDAESIVRRYAPVLGKTPTAIRIGNQKTLWGSCSARGLISLNRRLLAAPKPIFEYVVVHELCHLIERNHSTAFWNLVASLLPDYRERRAWLKRHGIALG